MFAFFIGPFFFSFYQMCQKTNQEKKTDFFLSIACCYCHCVAKSKTKIDDANLKWVNKHDENGQILYLVCVPGWGSVKAGEASCCCCCCWFYWEFWELQRRSCPREMRDFSRCRSETNPSSTTHLSFQTELRSVAIFSGTRPKGKKKKITKTTLGKIVLNIVIKK